MQSMQKMKSKCTKPHSTSSWSVCACNPMFIIQFLCKLYNAQEHEAYIVEQGAQNQTVHLAVPDISDCNVLVT